MKQNRMLVGAMLPALGATVLAGCISVQRETAAPPPPPTPATVVVQVPREPQRVVTYADGRYEVRGNGSTVPYHWVWVPAGATLAAPPPPPATAVMVTPSQRTVTYPNGRYELRGDGVSVPYYWVWIPSGYNPPWPPQPPV